jgi:hypothetical protein
MTASIFSVVSDELQGGNSSTYRLPKGSWLSVVVFQFVFEIR